MSAAHRATVRVGERELSLSNLDKVLYPATGTTKAEVIEYYARVAATMLPHLDGRCITLKRFPDGVEKQGFFEKRCPKHRPAWIDTAVGPGDRNGDIGYCCLDEPAALVWAANMAALELHVPMARSADLGHAAGRRLRLRSRSAGSDARVLRGRAVGARRARRGRPARDAARRRARRVCSCTCR